MPDHVSDETPDSDGGAAEPGSGDTPPESTSPASSVVGAAGAIASRIAAAAGAVVSRLAPTDAGSETPLTDPEPPAGTLSGAVVEVVAAGFGTASRTALVRLLDHLGIEQQSDGADLAAFGQGLRSVAELLGRAPGLRRALTEPARDGADRARLAHTILDGRTADPVAAMVADAAADRWSAPRDLVDGLDVAATAAEVAAAKQSGGLDSLEDDLFRFERIIDGDPPLRSALADRRAPAASKTALVHRLLDGKVSDAAVRLATAAVADLRGRSVETALTEIQALVAALQDRVVAVVRVASPLTPEQHADLARQLSSTVGHAVQLNVISDPSVLGGFRAEVGDTVIDATVATRLVEARRRMVG